MIPAITFSRIAIRGTLASALSFPGAETRWFAQMVNSALHARARPEQNEDLVGLGCEEIRVWAFLEAEIELPDELGDMEERFSVRSLVIK